MDVYLLPAYFISFLSKPFSSAIIWVLAQYLGVCTICLEVSR